MNYFKKSLALLLVTGLMISQAQAGIKVEVDGCNLVQPVINGVVKGLTNTFDILGRIRVPTISYVNPDAHTITTVYKALPALAGGAYMAAASGLFAYGAYDYYRKSEGSFKDKANTTTLAAISAVLAYVAGSYMFEPGFLAQQVTEYYN